MSDGDIIYKLKSGSEDTFRQLYDKYYYQLNIFAYHIVMCEESHDIVHDVFARLWERRQLLTIETNVNSYLYNSVRNSAFNYLKHNKVVDNNKKKITEAMLFVSDEWCEDEDALIDNLNTIIDKLPPQQRAVMKLRIKGKSYVEIAAELDISLKTVNNHIYKAYHFLRANILIQILLLLSR